MSQRIDGSTDIQTLRDLRERRGLTLEAVGFLAGIDPSTVSRIERGQQPHATTVVRLARGLGVSVVRLQKLIDAGRGQVAS